MSEITGVRLFVGNIDYQMLRKQLLAVFGDFELRDAYLPLDRTGSDRLNKGFAFVEADEPVARKIIETLDGQPDPFYHRPLRIREADPR